MLSEVRVSARSVLDTTKTPQRRLFDRVLFRVTTRASGGTQVMVTNDTAVIMASVESWAESSDREANDN